MERERLERAAEAIPERAFEEGQTVFEEGDDDRDLYVLLSGSVRVLKRGRQVAVIGESGAYFGEMSVLLGVPRTATVVAAEASRFLVVPDDHVEEFFGDTPRLALRIARGLAERLAKTTDMLVENWEVAATGAQE